jgi:hypothetical protein
MVILDESNSALAAAGVEDGDGEVGISVRGAKKQSFNLSGGFDKPFAFGLQIGLDFADSITAWPSL